MVRKGSKGQSNAPMVSGSFNERNMYRLSQSIGYSVNEAHLLILFSANAIIIIYMGCNETVCMCVMS